MDERDGLTSSRRAFAFPCGETVDTHSLDMGLRDINCDCGEIHAVVMDVHPPTRFLPEFLVEVLREVIETSDTTELGEFGMPHLMGLVLEEFPESVSSKDVSDDGYLGNSLVWVTSFDSRRLHEIIVELVIELMDHAVSHTDDETVIKDFEESMNAFDVSEFVDQYRAQRDLTAGNVPGY